MKRTFPHVEDGVLTENAMQLDILRNWSIASIRDAITKLPTIRMQMHYQLYTLRKHRARIDQIQEEIQRITSKPPSKIGRKCVDMTKFNLYCMNRKTEKLVDRIRSDWACYRLATECRALMPRIEIAVTEMTAWRKSFVSQHIQNMAEKEEYSNDSN